MNMNIAAAVFVMLSLADILSLALPPGDCGVGGQCHRQHQGIERSAMSNSSLILTPLMRNFRLTHPSPSQSSVPSLEGNVSSDLSEVPNARETANFTFPLIRPKAREVNITFPPAKHNITTAREVNFTFPTQPSGVSPDTQTAPDTKTSAPSTTSQTCPGCGVCEGKSEGLVRYPTTLAPASGSVNVTTQCADNAHRTSSSLSVTCTSSGSWSGTTPQCQCDTGYFKVTLNGTQACHHDESLMLNDSTVLLPAVVFGSATFFLVILSAVFIITITFVLRQRKLRKQKPKDAEACTTDGSFAADIENQGKREPENVEAMMVPNKTDASNNVSGSMKIPVGTTVEQKEVSV